MPYKDPEKEREYQATYYAANREKMNALALNRKRKYRKAHPELRAKAHAYNAVNYAINRNKILAQKVTYAAANPGTMRAIRANRRAMEISQRCACCTNAEIRKVYDVAAFCGVGSHVDHRVQLALGGPHCSRNLEALTVEAHKEKTRLDSAARADARRRNLLLRGWPRLTGELH
jgi:hypothetical protein